MRLLEPDSLPPDVRLGDSLRYWQRASQLALEALAGQQTIPGLKHREDGLYARWLPLLDNQRLERLAGATAYLHWTAWDGQPLSVLEAMALGRPYGGHRRTG